MRKHEAVLLVALMSVLIMFPVVCMIFSPDRRAYSLPPKKTVWESIEVTTETRTKVQGQDVDKYVRVDAYSRPREMECIYSVISRTSDNKEGYRYVVRDQFGTERECLFAADLPAKFKPRASYGHPKCPHLSAWIIDADTGQITWKKS